MVRIRLLAILPLLASLLLSNAHASISTDGANGRINCGSDDSLDDIAPVTYSVWIYPITQGEGNNARVFAKTNGASDSGFIFVRFDGSNRFLFSKDYSSTNLVVTPSTTPVFNQWQHFALTWTGGPNASSDVQMYLDGIEMTDFTLTNGVGTISSDAARSLNIANLGDNTRTWNGQMTDFAIWRAVLNVNDIKRLASSRVKGLPLTISPDSLVSYWPLNDYPDQGIGTLAGSAIDRKGINHGTPVGNPTGKAEEWISYQ